MIGLAPGDAYVIVEDGGGLGVWVKQTVVITRRRDAAGGYWTADDRGETSEFRKVTSWNRSTDSRSCPALAKVAEDAARLPKHAKSQLAFDVPLTSISVRRAGRLQPLLEPDFVGPTAKWWWRAAEDLKPCWRNVADPQAATASP